MIGAAGGGAGGGNGIGTTFPAGIERKTTLWEENGVNNTKQ